MGMFDSVMVPCPKCGTKSEFQSKSGDCACLTYELADAPADVLEDVNRHAPNVCKKCGTSYHVKLTEEACKTCGTIQRKGTPERWKDEEDHEDER